MSDHSALANIKPAAASLDDDELDLSGIAQALSDLAYEGQQPQGISPNEISHFNPDDVDFFSNDWLHKVLAVQGWLCLDSPIAMNVPAAEAASQLMEMISPDPPDSCLFIKDDMVSLTGFGAQYLETWLTRSVQHREAFLEALEDDKSLKDATAEWVELWSEAEPLTRHPGKIRAEVHSWMIKNFTWLAQESQLELNPSYQRDSVWSISESQLLIDSILRGIPIPSVILTKIDKSEIHQIVDGKQRLTAILRFIGQHPAALEYARSVDAESDFGQDHKKFIRKKHLRSKDISKHYLPFRLPRYKQDDPLFPISGKYYCEIKNTEISIGGEILKVRSIFESPSSPYKVPVIVYENTRLQDIHHIFSIYNKQGRKLNAEELRNATYHHLALTKLLLVMGGDRPEPSLLAPYLPLDVAEDIAEMGALLSDCGFGTMRFRRTKVLSWVCALALQAPNKASKVTGTYSTPSTATHIDAMLKNISLSQSERHKVHPLSKESTLTTLARDMKATVQLHADVADAWSPRFRSRKGFASHWEELPLVASLLATFVIIATGNADKLRKNVPTVRALTENHPGPSKTQNKTQWTYVACVTNAVLRELEIDLQAAASGLEKKYGYSCIEVIQALAAQAEA